MGKVGWRHLGEMGCGGWRDENTFVQLALPLREGAGDHVLELARE